MDTLPDAPNDGRFKPGHPGGPGRPPTRIPQFLRRLAECDDPKEVERLVATGMRNPLIAAKLRAVMAEDLDLANRASEQVLDRVFGKARQNVEVAGQVDLRGLMTGGIADRLEE